MPNVFLIILIVLIAFTSCQKDEDKTDPEIRSFSLINNEISAGTNLQINYSISDNSEISQVRFRVAHISAKSQNFGAWKYVHIQNINGNEYSDQLNIAVPDTSLAGYYSLSMQVADMRGNGSKDSTIYFTISHPGIQPYFEDINFEPALNIDGILEVNRGDSLYFTGTAYSPSDLASVNVRLRDPERQDIYTRSYNLSDTVYTSWNLNVMDPLAISSEYELGNYLLILSAIDTIGHRERVEFKMRVN